jgi:hypothetical protein
MEALPAGAQPGPAWTRALFAAWAERPLPVLAPWAAGSLAIGAALLLSALAVALIAGPSEAYVPVFADSSAGAADVGRILLRNTAVLALQVLVCVGAFICTRPGEQQRSRMTGLAMIAGLSAWSFASQAWRLGHDLASAAHTLGLGPADLLARLCVHAVPELTALFLPLAACLSLARRGRSDDLAAAALLTAVVGLPVVACAAAVEVYLTPYVIPA